MYKAEGELGDNWIFLDDLIASGTTKEHVMDTIAEIVSGRHWTKKPTIEPCYVGDYLYNAQEFRAGGKK